MKHLLLALSLFLAACTARTSESHTVAIGEPAPEIRGEDVEGVPFKLSDYRGKVVVLDFWGHW